MEQKLHQIWRVISKLFCNNIEKGFSVFSRGIGVLRQTYLSICQSTGRDVTFSEPLAWMRANNLLLRPIVILVATAKGRLSFYDMG